MYPLAEDPMCGDCQEYLCEYIPDDEYRPFRCSECRMYWGLCDDELCGDGDRMRVTPTVGFGTGGVVTTVETPVLPGSRYYDRADDPSAVLITLCKDCGAMTRWARDERLTVLAEDFKDPLHFTALDTERSRLRQLMLDKHERWKRPPSPKYVVLNFPNGDFLQVPEDMLQER